MKQVRFLRFLVLFLLYISPVKLVAQVTVSDSLALVDLYDSTDGKNWMYENNTNWKTQEPVSRWAGIGVSNNRVVSIRMTGARVSGTVPASFKNLDGMLYIDLLDNDFKGPLLSYISHFKNIVSIHMGEGYLPGPFPDSFGYLSKLQTIYIYGANCNGPIPKSFGNLVSLGSMDIGYSSHSGDIPAEELSNLNFGPHSLVLTSNLYTFRELEPLVAAFKAKSKEDALEYDQQAKIPTLQLRDGLAVSAGGVLAHNTYKWYYDGPNGSLMATITGDSTFNPPNPGSYYATVTNSVATQLTLTSTPIRASTMSLTLCPLSSPLSISSDVTGSDYQWQESLDSVTFHNIADNAFFNGVQSAVLQLQNLPSSWYGRKYRCVAGNVNSIVYTVQFANAWLNAGTNNWENATNWSCGKIPDENTDVMINSGTVVVNSDVTVRSLHLANGVSFTVSPGHKVLVKH